jgi:hypothetical protein
MDAKEDGWNGEDTVHNKLWLTEDIQNGLIAIYAAHAAALAGCGSLEAQSYTRGFAAALATVALAFGIAVPDEIRERVATVSVDEEHGQKGTKPLPNVHPALPH